MKTLHLEQGSPEWLAWRLGGLGGSDMGAIILGERWPYEDSRYEPLLDMKITGRSLESNFAMRRGSWMESSARFFWEQLHDGIKADPVCVQHDDCDWMRASLDGLAELDDGRRVILEIKCPDWKQHNLALSGMLPDHYVPQVQYQMLVTGIDLLHYLSCTTNAKFGASKDEPKIAIVEVTPDPEFQAEILERGEAFWRKVVDGRMARRGAVA